MNDKPKEESIQGGGISGDEDIALKESKEKEKSPSKKQKKTSKEKELEHKLKEQQDKYLRLSADFDNYRKRTLKEKIEMTKYAGTEILTRILPVIDDFERAIASMKESQNCDAVRQGLELIYNKFKDYLNQQGVEEIDALHQEFNTDLHEAVTKIPAPKKDLKGKIVDVIEKGYKLNDRIIRYSKVVVGE
ncbi:MAG: molecular chaperone GrpE [Bacteroides sp. SM23_62_1]|nr:MAG: molecular chaperone GrpE [Bacteroides sp. SM23_62_1]